MFVKRLLFRFLVFVGILYALDRLDFWVIMTGMGALAALLTFLHILASPDSVKPA